MKKIIVIGDECSDVFNYGDSYRLSPEVPCPILDYRETVRVPGMAGNVARNLESLGLNVQKVTNSQHPLKIRYMDQEHNYTFLRMDVGVSIDTLHSKLTKELKTDFSNADALCIVDYGKGFLTMENMRWLSRLHDLVFIDTKYADLSRFPEHVVVKINEKEWHQLHMVDPIKCKLIITKGKDGATMDGKNFPIKEVKVYDRMGAGDTFMAALVWATLVQKCDLSNAIWWANKAASIAVQKKGTATVTEFELIKGNEWNLGGNY